MPHQPRSTAPQIGLQPELHRAKQKKREEVTTDQPGRDQLGVGTLSLRKHRGPRPADVYKQLFGREPDTDGFTGALLHTNANKSASDSAS